MATALERLQNLESRLRSNAIRERFTEAHDKEQIQRVLAKAFEVLKGRVSALSDRPLPHIDFVGLGIWDLAAFCAADDCGDAMAVGASIGALRLFDFANSCRWAMGSPEDKQRGPEHDSRIWRALGTMLYHYAIGRVHSVRHWFLDITIGCQLPYGFTDLRIANQVPEQLRSSQAACLDMVVLFIVAHELAHIVLGHVGPLRPKELYVGRYSIGQVEVASIPHLEEHAADLMAVELGLWIYQDERFLAQVGFFFSLLDLVEKLSIDPIFWGHSHPSPRRRLEYLQECLGDKKDLTGEGRAISDPVQALGSFDYLSEGLSEWILSSPGDFTSRPVFPEEYEENPTDVETINECARKNNEGDRSLAAGEASLARKCYEDALVLLRGSSYGEGIRIVCANLFGVLLENGSVEGALEVLAEGLNCVRRNQDRSAVLWLLQHAKKHLARCDACPVPGSIERTIGPLREWGDDRITAQVEEVVDEELRPGSSLGL